MEGLPIWQRMEETQASPMEMVETNRRSHQDAPSRYLTSYLLPLSEVGVRLACAVNRPSLPLDTVIGLPAAITPTGWLLHGERINQLLDKPEMQARVPDLTEIFLVSGRHDD